MIVVPVLSKNQAELVLTPNQYNIEYENNNEIFQNTPTVRPEAQSPLDTVAYLEALAHGHDHPASQSILSSSSKFQTQTEAWWMVGLKKTRIKPKSIQLENRVKQNRLEIETEK